MNETAPLKRYHTLDSFRGLAALMVALFHFKPDNLLTNNLLVNHAWLFVDFFFVLSGFVLTHTYFYEKTVSFKKYMRARFARLYPLYLYALLIMVVFECLKAFLYHHQMMGFTNPPFAENNLRGFLLNITLLTSFNFDPLLTWNTPGWTISAEFWVNTLIGGLFVYAFISRKFLPTTLIFFIAAFIGLVILDKGLDLTFDYGWLRCLLGFSIGMLIYHLHRRHAPRLNACFNAHLTEGITLLAVILVVIFHQLCWPLLPVFVFAGAIFVFASERGVFSHILQKKPFLVLGDISYSVYLNHVIVAIILEKILHLISREPSPVLSVGITIAYLAIVVSYSFITYQLIEKPARRALR